MKKFIASIVILGAAFSFASSAFAQSAGTTSGAGTTTAQVQTKRPNQQAILWSVLTKLQVTEDQKTKIKELVKANQKEVSELRKSVKAGTTTKADAQAKQKETRKAFLASVKAVLTPDQAKQFDALLKEETKKAREEAKAGQASGTASTTTTTGTKTGGG